jgi:hypothetical protein
MEGAVPKVTAAKLLAAHNKYQVDVTGWYMRIQNYALLEEFMRQMGCTSKQMKKYKQSKKLKCGAAAAAKIHCLAETKADRKTIEVLLRACEAKHG